MHGMLVPLIVNQPQSKTQWFLLVLSVKASQNQSSVLPSTVKCALASPVEKPRHSHASHFCQAGQCTTSHPMSAPNPGPFLGTQYPQFCQGKVFQSIKREKVFPKGRFFKNGGKSTGMSGDIFRHPLYKRQLWVKAWCEWLGSGDLQSHSQIGLEVAPRAPQMWGTSKTPTGSTAFPRRRGTVNKE